ncbi:MAG TPA: hypothetical protein VNY06_03265 [Methylocella sp.]|nr:hypothetical protein [Methylocella sp.]
MAQDPLSKPLTALDEGEKFDWLELLRCEYIGPRTFQRLLNRHGSAGAALAALPELIASGKAGRPIRIATIEETEREIEATLNLADALSPCASRSIRCFCAARTRHRR